MKLFSVTITGASDNDDPVQLYRLSRMYPFVEWAILLSSTKAGNHPRYPSNQWLAELSRIHELDREEGGLGYQPTMRLAAHLCGRTMREFMTGIRFDSYSQGWCVQHGFTESDYNRTFSRTQVNFNAAREKFTPEDIREMMRGWYETMDGNIITQLNKNNDWVHRVIQTGEHSVVRPHQILHDASGGRGEGPAQWQQPVAGVLNGYAGGLNPNNVGATLDALSEMIPEGYVWIDMESGVRDENDQLDMTKVQYILHEVSRRMESVYKP